MIRRSQSALVPDRAGTLGTARGQGCSRGNSLLNSGSEGIRAAGGPAAQCGHSIAGPSAFRRSQASSSSVLTAVRCTDSWHLSQSCPRYLTAYSLSVKFLNMATFHRVPRDDGRVGFNFPKLDKGLSDPLVEEAGLIARAAGEDKIGDPNPAQLYDVMFRRDDGTQGSRLGGFSVPAEIADDVAASLVSHGHSVE